MKDIFINLKRFEVSKRIGGICPVDDPQEWISTVIEKSVEMGLGKRADLRLSFLLPEGLIYSALKILTGYTEKDRRFISIGCQGVFREDITRGGNFGAFTSSLPALAAKNLGCTWSIIGHSEERKAKYDLLKTFKPDLDKNDTLRSKAKHAVSSVINSELLCALRAGLNVLLCIGETAQEQGGGIFEKQKARIEAVLKSQLRIGLEATQQLYANRNIVIGYEPVWAIGPGKIPPGEEYIRFVSTYIKKTVKEMFGFTPSVVYGGGLREENAGMIAGIKTIDGGLVALTKFTDEIAFEPVGLKRIIDKYLS